MMTTERETQSNRRFQLTRRATLSGGVLTLAAAQLSSPWGLPETSAAEDITTDDRARPLKVGLITDLHYADKAPVGSRHYRETLGKLDEAAKQFNQQNVDLVVELGDLIDAASSVDDELRYLETINRQYSAIADDRHYVLGNHCVDTLTKDEFLNAVGQEKSYKSFDRGGIHFVILDACFRSDGTPYGRRNFKWTDANVSDEELQWLQADLKANTKPVIVFAHQRLDVSNSHGVKNNADVRTILESSGNVAAVFQGHSHANDLNEINGIHYCTLVAMVEGSGEQNNGYSVLEIDPKGELRLSGFRKQTDRHWTA
ncbi:metallophosphoesterase [Roseiconus lacunae]|nr:metallophosphoesterase [Roseiconus lacunae]MCD0463542.1 metallophosphoesterase [Roseiconus lacunae]